jgi:hypothetical protein
MMRQRLSARKLLQSPRQMYHTRAEMPQPELTKTVLAANQRQLMRINATHSEEEAMKIFAKEGNRSLDRFLQ